MTHPINIGRTKSPNDAVKIIAKETAALKIQNQWRIYKNIKKFRVLRQILHKTERMQVRNLLKLLEPNEANLLRDYPQKVKIRFR